MSKELIEAISELARSREIQRSMVGRVRELLPAIDDAQRTGVRLVDIARTMEKNGFGEMKIKCLQNLLYQARKCSSRSVSKNSQTASAIPPRKLTNQAGTNGIDAVEIIGAARASMKTAIDNSFTKNLLGLNQPGERK